MDYLLTTTTITMVLTSSLTRTDNPAPTKTLPQPTDATDTTDTYNLICYVCLFINLIYNKLIEFKWILIIIIGSE